MLTIDELKKRPQWVIHQQKNPFQALHPDRQAKSTDASTWSTYDQAERATRAAKNVDGAGVVLANGVSGIDLDHCRNKETGEIAEWAMPFVYLLDSYSEISFSGDGLHILVIGQIERACKIAVEANGQKGGIEIYSQGRYFTWTGKHLPGCPGDIMDRQEQLLQAVKRAQAFKQSENVRQVGTTELPASQGSKTKYGQKALDDECSSVANAGQGRRNDQLNTSAFAIGQLIASGKLDRYQAEQALAEAARKAGLEDQEIEKTLQSGLEKGMSQPREGTIGPLTLLSPGDLPEVVIGGQMRNVVNLAVAALAKAEKEKPRIFVQSARLVLVGSDEKKRPIILQMSVDHVKNALTRAADFFRERKSGDEIILLPVSPPKEIAESILALNPSSWPFPALKTIVETPVMRPDGSILDQPGYDTETQLFYAPQKGMDLCKVPCTPSLADIKAAINLLAETIGEFPYVEQADWANGIALLLTPILRHAIPRHVPLALLDAPKQGTGKGLFADVVALIATGSSSPVLTMSDSEDEFEKRLTALLMEGSTIITIDNVSGKLQSRHLDAVLTADNWRGRILGQSKTVTVPQRATWLATGNNIRLGGDLARRCYRIRLDRQTSKPWQKSDFKHEDLATWVAEHRAELIAALLTLARAWFVAGKPICAETPNLGTFTGWAKMIGGILKIAGVQGFLSNLDKLYDEADEDSSQWEAFLQAWLLYQGDQWISSKDLAKKIKDLSEKDQGIFAGDDSENAGVDLAIVLPDSLQYAMKEKPATFSTNLGKALGKRIDACFGPQNYRLEKRIDKHTKSPVWRVIAGVAGVTYNPRADENVSSTRVSKNDIGNGREQPPQPPQDENRNPSSISLQSALNSLIDQTSKVKLTPAKGTTPAEYEEFF